MLDEPGPANDDTRRISSGDLAFEALEILTDHDPDSPLFNRLCEAIDDSATVDVDLLRRVVDARQRQRLLGLNDDPVDGLFPHDGTAQGQALSEMATVFTLGLLVGHEHAARGYPRPGIAPQAGM